MENRNIGLGPEHEWSSHHAHNLRGRPSPTIARCRMPRLLRPAAIACNDVAPAACSPVIVGVRSAASARFVMASEAALRMAFVIVG